MAGFRSPSFRPPCIHEAHFRHRGASVSGFLRPSATVAAWHPGPAAPVRGKASIPPGVVSTGSGAAVRRDLPGSASAYVHPCPENRASPKVSAHSIGVNRPGVVPHRSGSRLVVLSSYKVQQEAATARNSWQWSLPNHVPSGVFQLSDLRSVRLRRLSW